MFRSAASTLVRAAARSYATEAAAASSGKLTLNFVLPHQTLYKAKEVAQVNLSGASGDMGILAGHVPVIEELKPGVLEIVEKDGKKNKFFVSGGFAAVHPDSSINVTAIEAFSLESFDKESIRVGLDAANAKLASAKDAVESAEAKIEVEVFTALQNATK
ncbi:ATP synthase F1, epsilon subunit [Allomyces macrogynus ATCC 38327]|uniref:ATP synthase subunit delta, mitochondrial n=1 Tax=Allomyces macrogynus (strain ATCC 38327) TaxID=578462 RepID=A0A0L0SW69_ALLM3|nr:ATP synthase F1, epsilon subunit [Allomyces macrogynus ATCC 38327]|eukprot:KNE66630.1 ATP synthase F1, epsilon subunit [Allomyces macrogynus ATCC 38327]